MRSKSTNIPAGRAPDKNCSDPTHQPYHDSRRTEPAALYIQKMLLSAGPPLMKDHPHPTSRKSLFKILLLLRSFILDQTVYRPRMFSLTATNLVVKARRDSNNTVRSCAPQDRPRINWPHSMQHRHTWPRPKVPCRKGSTVGPDGDLVADKLAAFGQYSSP